MIHDMSPFKAFKLFRCLKLHFETKNYDFFKYQGKAKNIDPIGFEERKDYVFYRKLVKIPNLQDYLIANFIVAKEPLWVGQILTPEAQETYDKWRCRMESFSYVIKREYGHYLEYRFIPTRNYPPVIDMLFKEEINLETALIIESIHPFIEDVDKNFSWDPIWQDLKRRLIKYRPFLIKYLKDK